MRRALDPEEEVASRVCLCLAKAIEHDREAGLELAKRLHTRDEILIRRGMADVLTRLFRRLTWDAVPFLEAMLKDEDEGVLAAASATVGDLRFLDVEQWADTMAELSTHPLPVVRRNLARALTIITSDGTLFLTLFPQRCSFSFFHTFLIRTL